MKKRFPVFVLALLFALLASCAQAAVVPPDDPVEEGYVQDDPVEDDPVEDNPVEDNPVEDNPVEDDPVEDDPVEDGPVEDVPVQNIPAQNNSSQNTTVQNNYTDDYIAANHTYSNGRPYYIMVNRAQSTVTVYGLDANGYYTVPVKAMICSTGRQGHATYTGTYTLGGKWQWVHMVDDSYGQYVSQITGNILFHSVCYYQKDCTTLITEEYNGLGAPASLGCVRLQTADAKWIYDNCAPGTRITIYDGSSPGPLGKPDRLVDYIDPSHPASGWDPTDPRAENPWHAILEEMAANAKPEEPDGEDVPGGDADIPETDPGDEGTPGAGPTEPGGEDVPGGDADIPVTDPDAEGTPDVGPAEPGGEDVPGGDADIPVADPDDEGTPDAGPAEPDGEDVPGGDADIPVTDPGDEGAPDAGPAEPDGEDVPGGDPGVFALDPDSTDPAINS